MGTPISTTFNISAIKRDHKPYLEVALEDQRFIYPLHNLTSIHVNLSQQDSTRTCGNWQFEYQTLAPRNFPFWNISTPLYLKAQNIMEQLCDLHSILAQRVGEPAEGG